MSDFKSVSTVSPVKRKDQKLDLPIAGPAVIRSEALMGNNSHITILHKDELYFLRQTRLGKLILTK